MSDIIYLLLVGAFFTIASLLVRGCEAMIGAEDTEGPGR
jgi:hypothetical protein